MLRGFHNETLTMKQGEVHAGVSSSDAERQVILAHINKYAYTSRSQGWVRMR